MTSLAMMAVASVSAQDIPGHTPGFRYKPKGQPAIGSQISQGCFLSQGSLKVTPITQKGPDGEILIVTSGVCINECKRLKKDVMALHGEYCLCGDKYPPKDSITKDEACDTECFGYQKEPCGNIDGTDAWSVYNMGTKMAVEYDESDTKSSSTAAAPSTTNTGSSETSGAASKDPSTDPTDSNGPDSDKEEEKKGGSNVAGIAAGVVVGVVVIAGIIGGGFFFMRRRRNAEIEEEHRRNAAVNAFISGAKPPGSSDNMSMSDSRLEPGLAHRRLSDGSIADNQDYSRKILRVTNA